jgi:hypothetical protein
MLEAAAVVAHDTHDGHGDMLSGDILNNATISSPRNGRTSHENTRDLHDVRNIRSNNIEEQININDLVVGKGRSDKKVTFGGIETSDKLAYGSSEMPNGWIKNTAYICSPLTVREKDVAYEMAEKDIVKVANPVPEDKVPHIIIAVGSPGSGKSTLSKLLIDHMKLYTESQYVDLDFDTLIQYHPRYGDILNVKDMKGQPTGLGYGMGYIHCGESMDSVGAKLINKLFADRYNIILHTHGMNDILWARHYGYRVTLLYVVTSLPVSRSRAEARAWETGRFLAGDKAAQDDHITWAHNRYRVSISWYGLWANDMYIIENNDDTRIPSPDDLTEVTINDDAILDQVSVIHEAVAKVVDKVEPKKQKKASRAHK